MPARKVDHLLIGGGLASANCARWLRESGARGEILLVGREPDPPYNRPECSKGYLRGQESREEPLFRPNEWWGEQSIELLTRTSVTGLDLHTRTAKLSTKQEIEFDTALLATGANVRRLNVEGCELDEIHYLRTLSNADSIREGVADAENVVLIGGSYIGCEVAASLTMMGKRCTIVMQEDATLERGFGKRAGRFFQGMLESHGVTVHGADGLDRFEGDWRVAKVVTRNGLELPAEAVVIGAGVTADVLLAPSDLRPGHIRGRRHRRVRLAAARRPRAHRALGRRLQPRQDRCAEHARRGRAPRSRSLLLFGARRLGGARVRGPRLRAGRGGPARLLRGRELYELVPQGRPRPRRAHVRALGRPRPRTQADRRAPRARRGRSRRAREPGRGPGLAPRLSAGTPPATTSPEPARAEAPPKKGPFGTTWPPGSSMCTFIRSVAKGSR